jgi:sucrose phosphorylase
VERTGVGRDINRHFYSAQEIRSARTNHVVKRLAELMRLRRGNRAFEGEFQIETRGAELTMQWNGRGHASLVVDLAQSQATLNLTVHGEPLRYLISRDATGPIAAASPS